MLADTTGWMLLKIRVLVKIQIVEALMIVQRVLYFVVVAMDQMMEEEVDLALRQQKPRPSKEENYTRMSNGNYITTR